MIRWTEEQEEAISSAEKSILVSAAAGSGKTAVLTERIVNKLIDPENPLDTSSLLVVTFTSAAASEMRERIVKKLTEKMEAEPENELILRQLSLIDAAAITTIHSFCLNMIKENFVAAGVDPAFKIAEPTESALIKLEAISECLDEMYEDEEFSSGFIRLSENYPGSKNMDSLSGLALSLYNFVMSLPEPEKWLDEAAEGFSLENSFDDLLCVNIAIESAKEIVEEALVKYKAIIKKAELDDDVPEVLSLLKDEYDKFECAAECNSYTGLYEILSKLSFKDFPRPRKGFSPIYRNEIKAVRDEVKKSAGTLCSNFFNLSAEETLMVRDELYPCVLALSEFIKRIIKRFNEKKAKRNILDFNDLEHLCYRLFVNEAGEKTDLAIRTSRRFAEILIDEYQDTSRLQESIFAAISGENNTFMVGDIKQSIYRFRNTDPLLFRDKCDTFSTEAGAEKRKILLSMNFRSRESVLSAINFFFSRLMSRNAGEIDYNEAEMLYKGASFPECLNPPDYSTEINIIDRAMETEAEDENLDELEAAELEAEYIADKIEELIVGGYEVAGKKNMQRISYRDICILMRTTKNVSVFTEVLSERGIPVFADSADGFFDAGEIDTVISFLKIIDNPYQDIPLLAVMRSPIYSFTTNELAEIRVQKKNADFFTALSVRAVSGDDLGRRISDFLKELDGFRMRAKTVSTHELVWELYMKSGFYDYVGALKNGRLKQANLRNLYIRAAEFDKTGFKGLYSFVSFLEEYKSAGSDFAGAKLISEEMNVVRIMSIHKSKGLEFPVVILAECGKKMNKRDAYGAFLFHPSYGYGPKYVDPALRITCPTLFKTAITNAILNESMSEEMRILYVALSRAKEKLIIFACADNLSNYIKRWKRGEYNNFKINARKVLGVNFYIDWIGMCLINHPDGKCFSENDDEETVYFETNSRFKINILPPKIGAEARIADSAGEKTEPAYSDEIIRLINEEYRFKDMLGVPSKITVTELKRRMTEENEGAAYLYKPQMQKPGSGKVSAAARGIAFHTVMEHIDFKGECDESAVIKTADSLAAQGFLTFDEKNSLDIEKLCLFFKSELFNKVRNADEIHREVMFAIKEKAEVLGLAASSAEVLVQGVIDLVLKREDEILIVDYKTDRNISAHEAAEKYRVQLICYSLAVKKLFGAEAKHAYLYMFENGEFAEVNLDKDFLSYRFDEQPQYMIK